MKYRDFVKAHAGKGMTLKQIAAKWQASKAQLGGADPGPGAGSGGLDIIYVAVIRDDDNITEILTISTDMESAINAIVNAKTFPNWFGATFGIVVQTTVNTTFPDGIINEHPIYSGEYDREGNFTPNEDEE